VAKIRQKLDRAEWAKLSQDVQALYVERNGVFVLDSDDAEELRGAFDRTKQELAESRRRLAELGDVDAQEYQRLKEAEQKQIRERDLERGNYEKIRLEDEKTHQAALKKAADREAGIKAQLEESLVDGEITRAIASYPGAKVTPLLLGAKRNVRLQEIGGRLRAVVLDEKGEPRLKAGAKTADDYMSPVDLVTEMRNDKEWAGNFPAASQSPGPTKTAMLNSDPRQRARRDVVENIANQVREGGKTIQ
jgi:hypothetical protein